MPVKRSLLEELESLLCKKAEQEAGAAGDVSSDLNTIMAATEKVLAVNKGHAEPDERDSLEFRKIHTPGNMMAERIQMDAGKVRATAMRRIAKRRNLDPISVSHFDPYIEGILYGNPLCLPLEETNTNQLIEQARRISGMGVGGLSSDDSISAEAQSLNPSTFGFLSAIEGPESGKIGVDTRLAIGSRIGSDGKIYRKMRHVPTGQDTWVSASDLHNSVVGLPE